jgi:hypothetical protein
MKANIGLVVASIVVTFLIAEGCLRLSGWQEAHYGHEKYLPTIKPSSFLVKDELLGWKLGVGKFDFFYGDTLYSSCKVNIDGNRLIPIKKTLDKSYRDNNYKKISLYGCSYTFGLSVSDTSNYPFYLQMMLPEYLICNRAVPGYSLVQMYLSIQRDVQMRNKPDIALINYGTFLDERTVLNRIWLNRFGWALKKRMRKGIIEVNYPFAKLKGNDSLIIDYLQWKDWHEDWPYRDKSAVLNMANTMFDNESVSQQKEKFSRIVLLCLIEMADYCKKHGIKVIFYGFDKTCDPVFQHLKSKGLLAIVSSVDIHEVGFNCAPFDPQHPSSKSHRIYAQEVYDCLLLSSMIKSTQLN